MIKTILSIVLICSALSAQNIPEVSKIGPKILMENYMIGQKTLQEYCFKNWKWLEYRVGNSGSFSQMIGNNGKPIYCKGSK